MSGVLQRMVKQARNAQPTVQPLSAPRFAPVAGATPDRLTETTVYAEESQRQRENPQAARSVGIESPARQIAATPPLRDASKPQTLLENKVEATRKRTVSPELDDTGFQPFPTLESHIVPQGKPQRQAAPPTPTDSPEASFNFASAAEEPRSQYDIAEALGHADLDRPSAAKLTAPERAELAMEVKTSPRRDAALQAEPQIFPTEQRTEVHISIGSIELRAPQAEARPQAPAFRPRVSLDDFLGRKSGAGA